MTALSSSDIFVDFGLPFRVVLFGINFAVPNRSNHLQCASGKTCARQQYRTMQRAARVSYIYLWRLVITACAHITFRIRSFSQSHYALFSPLMSANVRIERICANFVCLAVSLFVDGSVPNEMLLKVFRIRNTHNDIMCARIETYLLLFRAIKCATMNMVMA